MANQDEFFESIRLLDSQLRIFRDQLGVIGNHVSPALTNMAATLKPIADAYSVINPDILATIKAYHEFSNNLKLHIQHSPEFELLSKILSDLAPVAEILQAVPLEIHRMIIDAVNQAPIAGNQDELDLSSYCAEHEMDDAYPWLVKIQNKLTSYATVENIGALIAEFTYILSVTTDETVRTTVMRLCDVLCFVLNYLIFFRKTS